MDLTGFYLGAWLTKSGAVVLVHEYDDVTQVFIGHVVHPMREVRYGKDGRLVSCCFLGGESQTVEHEQKLHAALHLDRRLDLGNDAIYVTNIVEWMDSAVAGIYDEVPPPIHPEINEEKLKEVATLDDPLGRFNVPELLAEPEVIPPTEYRFHICTAESDWNLRGTHFEWSGDSLAVYLCDECVAWIRNATSCTRENPYPGPKPVVPTVTLDMLTPLGDSIDNLYRLLVICNGGSQATKDAARACVERFNNLVKSLK